MSTLTEAQKKAIEDSNNFDWNNAPSVNPGQGALTSNISNLPSFNFTGISIPRLGFNANIGIGTTNIGGGTLPSGRSIGGLYSTVNPVNKMNKLNESGSADESSGTEAAAAKAKKKFTETKFGSGLKAAALSTPLGQGIKGISGLVKKIKAKKAAKQTENKEE